MTTKQDEMTAAFRLAAAQRESAAAARTRLELTGRTDNPGAAVGIAALIVLVLVGAGGIAVGLWFLAQVTR